MERSREASGSAPPQRRPAAQLQAGERASPRPGEPAVFHDSSRMVAQRQRCQQLGAMAATSSVTQLHGVSPSGGQVLQMVRWKWDADAKAWNAIGASSSSSKPPSHKGKRDGEVYDDGEGSTRSNTRRSGRGRSDLDQEADEEDADLTPMKKAERDSAQVKSFLARLREQEQAPKKKNPSYTISAEIHKPGLLTQKPTRKEGNLTAKDYEEGYISDEGGKLHETVRGSVKEQEEIEQIEKNKVSRHGNAMKLGEPEATPYYGSNITYRVDYTKPKSDDTAKWSPRARVMVADLNMTTRKAAENVDLMSRAQESEQESFLQGLSGQRGLDEEIDAGGHFGSQLRALARLSNIFDEQSSPTLDGLMLRNTASLEQARNLFVHPQFGTGALGTQNSGPKSVEEFQAYNAVLSTGKASTNTRGTGYEQNAKFKKWSAMQSALPEGVMTVEKTQKAEKAEKAKKAVKAEKVEKVEKPKKRKLSRGSDRSESDGSPPKKKQRTPAKEKETAPKKPPKVAKAKATSPKVQKTGPASSSVKKKSSGKQKPSGGRGRTKDKG
jgi:hypothetical protein